MNFDLDSLELAGQLAVDGPVPQDDDSDQETLANSSDDSSSSESDSENETSSTSGSDCDTDFSGSSISVTSEDSDLDENCRLGEVEQTCSKRLIAEIELGEPGSCPASTLATQDTSLPESFSKLTVEDDKAQCAAEVCLLRETAENSGAESAGDLVDADNCLRD